MASEAVAEPSQEGEEKEAEVCLYYPAKARGQGRRFNHIISHY